MTRVEETFLEGLPTRLCFHAPSGQLDEAFWQKVARHHPVCRVVFILEGRRMMGSGKATFLHLLHVGGYIFCVEWEYTI
jgi:hypothetical protein